MNEKLELMKQRHSVRQYCNKVIEQEKREYINQWVEEINLEADLHFQVFYDEPTCFDHFMAHYGKFEGVQNYIALVAKKNKNCDEKVGYYGEKLVLKLQELGLNTCWVALTHGKSQAKVLNDEKCICLISFGYGLRQGTIHSNKPIEKISNYNKTMPQWFLDGIQAALLAPTAMNQQKFYLEYIDENTVKLKAGMGFYSRLDLGIVKYHFEWMTNRKVELC